MLIISFCLSLYCYSVWKGTLAGSKTKSTENPHPTTEIPVRVPRSAALWTVSTQIVREIVQTPVKIPAVRRSKMFNIASTLRSTHFKNGFLVFSTCFLSSCSVSRVILFGSFVFRNGNCDTVGQFHHETRLPSSLSVHFTSGVPPSRPPIWPDLRKRGGTARGGHLEPLWDPILDQNPFRKHQKVHFFAPAALLIYRFPFENPPKSQNFRPPEADFCRKPLYKPSNHGSKPANIVFWTRRRRFLARNPFRNPQNSEIFRPPEAAERRSQISSSEGGQPEGGGHPK